LTWINWLTALRKSLRRSWPPGRSWSWWWSRSRTLLPGATLLTIGLRFEAIVIAATTAIVELTTCTIVPIKVPLEGPFTAIARSSILLANVPGAGSWPGRDGGGGGGGFRLAIATCQTGLFGGEAVLIASTATVVELAAALSHGVVVPARNIVVTLARLGRNITDVLG